MKNLTMYVLSHGIVSPLVYLVLRRGKILLVRNHKLTFYLEMFNLLYTISFYC